MRNDGCRPAAAADSAAAVNPIDHGGFPMLLRIRNAIPMTGHRLRLELTDGTALERDVGPLLVGPVFEALRNDPVVFRQVRVEHGTVTWPGDVDLCPDVVIHGESGIPVGDEFAGVRSPRLAS